MSGVAAHVLIMQGAVLQCTLALLTKTTID
jgi:hypothetical protein